jgi:hypothetical protein
MEERFSKEGRLTEGRVGEDKLSELLSKMAAQQSATRKPALSSDPNAPAADVAAGSGKGQPNTQYVDSADVRETFADSINAAHFDGQSLRLEFGVTRVKRSDPSAPQTFQRFPACRLVLTPSAVTELSTLMQNLAERLKSPSNVGRGEATKVDPFAPPR